MTALLLLFVGAAVFWLGYAIGKRHKTLPAYVRGWIEGWNEGSQVGFRAGIHRGADAAEAHVVRQRELARARLQ